jgi:hypothetical protein
MAIPQTARMQENLSKTAKLNEVGVGAPFTWLKQGVGDLMAVPVLSLFNGALFAIITYGLWTYLDGSQTFARCGRTSISGNCFAIRSYFCHESLRCI